MDWDRRPLFENHGSGMMAPSPILEALYRHAYQEAEGLAQGTELSMWEAAALGRVEALALAEALGTNLRHPSPDGFTALHLACYFGRLEAAGWLLARGADPRAPGPGGLQPLHAAAACPDAEAVPALVETLLRAGADANAVQQGGFTALHAAAQRGSRELAELLIQHGADSNLQTAKGETAQDLAQARGDAEWAEWLHAQV